MRLKTMMLIGTLCVAPLAGACGSPAGPATAQQVSQTNQHSLPPALVAILASPSHRAALLQAAHAVEVPGGPPCRDENYVTTGDVGVLEPLQIGANGQITGGAWKESIRATGCGGGRLLNTLTTAGPGGGVQTQPLLPGTTITDPQLQRDSVDYAAAAMGDMPAGCDQGAIVNTRFVGMDGEPAGSKPLAGVATQPWTEIWTLRACAMQVEVTMRFKPDTTGTEIRADRLGATSRPG